MRTNLLTFVSGIAALSLCLADEPNGFERGGVTFDFAKFAASRMKFEDPANPSNLVTSATDWKRDMTICHDSIPHGAAPFRTAREGIEYSRENGVFTVRKLKTLQDSLKQYGFENLHCRIEGEWRAFLPVEAGRSGAHRISFRYRCHHELAQVGYSFGAGLLIHHYSKRDAKTGRYSGSVGSRALRPLANTSGEEWREFSTEFSVPAKAIAFDVELRHDGVGTLEVKDICVLRVPERENSVEVRLSPQAYLDNTFVFSEGQAAHLTWQWRDSKASERRTSNYEIRLALPSGFEYIDDSFSDIPKRKVTRREDGSSEVSLRIGRGNFGFKGSFQSWDEPGFLVRPTGPVGTAGECVLSVYYKGENVGESDRIRFTTAEKVVAECPERFLFAAMPGMGPSNRFTTPEGVDAFMKTFCEIGVRLYAAGSNGMTDSPKLSQPMYAAFRRHGGRRITAILPQVRNAYYIGFPSRHPPEDRYVTDIGARASWHKFVTGSVCPKAIHEERGDFVTNTVPHLKRCLANCDGLRANYEPFMYFGNGCYCDRCREDFAKYAGVDAEELRKEWPAAVKPKARLAKKFQHYRSLELGKVASTLDKYIRECTGGDDSMGFIPAPSWRQYTDFGVAKGGDSDYCPRDYNERLKWVAPWGPYVKWSATGSYNYRKGAPLAHFVVTKNIRRTLDRDYPAERRPKLSGGTQGLQCGEWLTQPEWLEMALCSYFFNRWDAVQAYFFPEGYDARYLRAYANASTRAAKYERYVWDGSRDDDSVELRPVREYALPASYVSSFLPDEKDVSLLQCAAWKLGGAKAVAVFNFWERGEAFFELRVKGLEAGAYRLVGEGGVLYAKDDAVESFTAAELGQGVRLMVPAARTRVFEVVPVGAAERPAKRIITQARLRARYEEVKPLLTAAAEEDVALKAAQAVKVVDDKAEL